MKEKVIICFFGVVSRSIKYTYKNLEEKLINLVKENYDVDIYVFNNNVENIQIDDIPQNNQDVELLQRTFFEEKTQNEIDSDIKTYIKSKNIVCKFRPNYDDILIKNAIRQMYSENQIGLFLQQNITNYKCAIICGPDYYLLNDVNLNDVENSINNKSCVYTTQVNDACGYTNGFYIGSLQPLIKILTRYSILDKLLPTDNDYEHVLQQSFYIHNITRLITDTVFVKIRSNKHIALQGIMQYDIFTSTIRAIQI